MPNVVDVSAIEPVLRVMSDRVLFVADFRYEPNVNAARFLVDEVMPAFWAVAPTAKLTLVGRGLELPEPTDPRIDLLGFVPDLDDGIRARRVCRRPLLQGGGSPLKMIEAMAYGLPVVATSVAAAGLREATPGVHYSQPTAQRSRHALAVACSGEHSGVGQAGRALAESTYSIEALAKLIP